MESNLNDYINTYVEVVCEYIKRCAVAHDKPTKSAGFRAITHIFQLNYLRSKNLIDAFGICKQAMVFYLEYIEQISKENIVCYNDAVTFVYNKMLVINIDSGKMNYPNFRVSNLIYKLLWWDNPLIDQQKINKDIIIQFACLSESDFLNSYIDIAQQRIMDTHDYIEFLTETYKIIKKNNKLPDADKWIIKYVSKKTDWEANSNIPIKQWCKWLII